MSIVAFATFLKRLAAPVRRRSAAKGLSMTLVVRMCFQCSSGEVVEGGEGVPALFEDRDHLGVVGAVAGGEALAQPLRASARVGA